MRMHFRVRVWHNRLGRWQWRCPGCLAGGGFLTRLSTDWVHRAALHHARTCDILSAINRKAMRCWNCDGRGYLDDDACIVCLGRGCTDEPDPTHR